MNMDHEAVATVAGNDMDHVAVVNGIGTVIDSEAVENSVGNAHSTIRLLAWWEWPLFWGSGVRGLANPAG